jgi:DMSO/TMAO reductase YedYZ molybdopterin-dependent catalytic subunit
MQWRRIEVGTLHKAEDSAGSGSERPHVPERAALERAWRAASERVGPATLAAVIGIAAMFAVRLIFGVLTPAEIFGDRLTALIPLGLFSALLTFFGHDAKYLFFAVLVIGQGVATAALVISYWGARVALATGPGRSRAAEPPAREPDGSTLTAITPRALDVVALPVVYWVASAGVLAPLIGGGVFGSHLLGGAVGVLVAEIAPALATAAAFVALGRRASPTAVAGPSSLARRRMLRQVGFGLVVLAGGALAWRFIEQGAAALGLARASSPRSALDVGAVPRRISPPPTPNYGPWTPVSGQSAELTPTANFYYVSKNLVSDPDVNAAAWRLTINGLVDRPSMLTLDQLRALPSVEQYQTLECISNEVGGNLMSTARWTGVRLADLLAPAGVRAEASELIFHCADGYSDSLHLAQALGPQALLVYAMDGQPLPQAHGFPARLLIPGLYGMKNGKWITGLEAGAGGYQGYWEQQGWSREARVKTTARIDVPADGDLLAVRPTFIAGVAFAGDRGIARVDVSIDSGRSWTAATLRHPLAEQTWVLWELPWRPTSGTHLIVVRAIEPSGVVQSPSVTPPLPDGASGYHAITVIVG